jgi:hypothetical protein
MVGRVLAGVARSAAKLLPLVPLVLSGSLACATLEEVAPGCGNHVVEESEDCDGTGSSLCGEQDTQHQCRFVWDETHPCPEGYAASPDKRCRKGSGDLAFRATLETPGRDPQIGDFGGDGSLELGMSEIVGTKLTIYSVNGFTAERITTLPTFGAIAMGEVSGDASSDIVAGTEAISGVACSAPTVEDGTEPVPDASARAGLSVLRSLGDSFSLKVYANGTYGEAVRFSVLPSWLFGSCEIFDLDVLTRMALVDGDLEICAIDDCNATKATFPTVIANAELGLASNDAYAVVSVQGQSQLLYVAREGFPGLAQALASPEVIKMPAGAHVEAGVVLADINGDQWDDVVVVGSDAGSGQGPFQLYVLRGRAPATGGTYATLDGDTLEPWLAIEGFQPADDGSTVLSSGHINGDAIPDFFLGDRVLVSTGAPIPSPAVGALSTYYRSECWVATGGGFGDGYCDGSRVAAIGDVNGDGLDDLVGTGGGYGTFTLQVVYGGETLPLVRFDLPTDALGTGLVARVGLSDFDGDGAADILGSFVPTQDGEPITPTDSCDASQSLVIAYGHVGALPDTPAVIAQVPPVKQIATGKFRSPADGFGDFAVAVSCGSSATLFGDPYRRMSSPFQFDDEATASFRPSQISIRDVVQSDDDLLDEDGNVVPHADLIVGGTDDSADRESSVLLLPSWGDATLSLAASLKLEAPARWRDAYNLSLQPAALGVEAASDIVGMAGVTIAYAFDETDFSQSYTFTGDWAIARGVGGAASSTTALPFPEPELFVELAVNEGPTSAPFARVAMTDLNGDDQPDFVVVYGIELVSFDGFTGSDDVALSVAGNRVVSAAVLAVSNGDSYAVKAVSGIDSSYEAVVDVAVLDGKLFVVAEQSLYDLDPESGTASFAAPLGIDVPAREAAVGDFSGDGLNDLVVFDGSRGYLLEQQPLNP